VFSLFCSNSFTLTHTHTQTHSLSLSLSLSHTHALSFIRQSLSFPFCTCLRDSYSMSALSLLYNINNNNINNNFRTSHVDSESLLGLGNRFCTKDHFFESHFLFSLSSSWANLQWLKAGDIPGVPGIVTLIRKNIELIIYRCFLILFEPLNSPKFKARVLLPALVRVSGMHSPVQACVFHFIRATIPGTPCSYCTGPKM